MFRFVPLHEAMEGGVNKVPQMKTLIPDFIKKETGGYTLSQGQKKRILEATRAWIVRLLGDAPTNLDELSNWPVPREAAVDTTGIKDAIRPTIQQKLTAAQAPAKEAQRRRENTRKELARNKEIFGRTFGTREQQAFADAQKTQQALEDDKADRLRKKQEAAARKEAAAAARRKAKAQKREEKEREEQERRRRKAVSLARKLGIAAEMGRNVVDLRRRAEEAAFDARIGGNTTYNMLLEAEIDNARASGRLDALREQQEDAERQLDKQKKRRAEKERSFSRRIFQEIPSTWMFVPGLDGLIRFNKSKGQVLSLQEINSRFADSVEQDLKDFQFEEDEKLQFLHTVLGRAKATWQVLKCIEDKKGKSTVHKPYSFASWNQTSDRLRLVGLWQYTRFLLDILGVDASQNDRLAEKIGAVEQLEEQSPEGGYLEYAPWYALAEEVDGALRSRNDAEGLEFWAKAGRQEARRTFKDVAPGAKLNTIFEEACDASQYVMPRV